MQRVALVHARSRARGSLRWLAVGVLVAGVLIAIAARAVAADPVAYGVTVWPFADDADRAEAAVLAGISAAVVAHPDGLAGVPALVRRLGVDVRSATVDRPESRQGTVLLRIALAGPRCRDVLVRADDEVTSRRVVCG